MLLIHRSLDSAREAFQDADEIFNTKLTSDDRKRDIVHQAACLEDVMQSVKEAQDKYFERHRNQKAQEWLVKFSARVKTIWKHYGRASLSPPRICCSGVGSAEIFIHGRCSIFEHAENGSRILLKYSS